MTMKKIDWKSVYGPETEALHRVVVHALQQEEEKPVKRKNYSAVLIAALVIVLLAATAVAVSQRVNLLDFVFTYNHVPKDMTLPDVLTDIPQEGGETKHAIFRAREAVYDGFHAFVLIEAVPKAETDVLVWDMSMGSSHSEKEILGLGDRKWGVRLHAEAPEALNTPSTYGLPYAFQREGRGMVFIVNAMLPDGDSLESVDMTTTFSLIDEKDGTVAEETTVSFTVCRTADPTTVEFEPKADLETVRIDSVQIAHTPIEMIVTIVHQPLLRVFGGFVYLPEDGLVNHLRGSGQFGFPEDVETMAHTTRLMIPTSREMPEAIPLWLRGTDKIIVIDTRTGEIITEEATVSGVGGDTVVRRKE